MMSLSQLRVLTIVLSCFVTVCLSDEIRIANVRSLGDLLLQTEASSSNDSSQDECAICLSMLDKDAKINKLECNHSFHEHCIGRWLSEHDTCPVCRAKLRSSTVVTTSIFDQVNSTIADEPNGRSGFIIFPQPIRASGRSVRRGSVVPRGSW